VFDGRVGSSRRAACCLTPNAVSGSSRRAAGGSGSAGQSSSSSETDAAPAWTIGNLRAGVTHVTGPWTLRAFVRVNNVTDVDYAGSVIVGDTNGRYFEPAPGRNVFAGASAHARF